MSTLDQADLDVMKASHTCVGAHQFQYDYLNDDINDFGQVDYSLTDKMPATTCLRGPLPMRRPARKAL